MSEMVGDTDVVICVFFAHPSFRGAMGANGSLCRSLGRPRKADGVPVNNICYSGRANQEIFRPSFAILSIVKAKRIVSER